MFDLLREGLTGLIPSRLRPAYMDQEQDPPDGSTWQYIAARKQKNRETILQKYSNWRLSATGLLDVTPLLFAKLTPLEIGIVGRDATGLAEDLASRKLTAVQVLTAHCKVAVASQDYTNCLTEIFFEEGMKRAEELDEHMRTTGRPVGPLHGVPVSIKDHILVKGHDTSSGYIAWAFKRPAEKDAVVVVSNDAHP